MINTETRVVAVMFSDIKDYSKINNDRLYTIIKEHISYFLKSTLRENNHLYSNTWGDGILICSNSAHDLLEIALSLNDSFMSKNWIRDGFSNQLMIRIGLHMDSINLKIENGKVADIDGKNVNKAARIEPIVLPGHIYCSDLFRQLAGIEGDSFVDFVPLGIKELAKEYGKLETFEILKKGSIQKPFEKKKAIIGELVIRIRKDYTELEMNDYLLACYRSVKDAFNEGMRALEAMDADIKSRYNEVRSDKFTCEVYIKGNKKSECQIWLGNSFGKGIHYYEKIDSNDNSSNEILTVQSDGYNLQLTGFGMGYIGIGPIRIDIKNVAEVLWKRFLITLER